MNISLSPLDYYFYRPGLYTMDFVFEYQGQIGRNSFQNALNETVRVIPALGSRLKSISATQMELQTGFSVECQEIILQTEPVDPILVTDYIQSVTNTEGKSLLSVLLTRTPTRSFVGFSFSHILGDGTSFFHFVRTLSSFCQQKSVADSFSNERGLLKASLPLVQTSFFASTGYVLSKPQFPSRSQTEIRHYTQSEIEEKRRSCQRRGFRVSNNDILMALIAHEFHASVEQYEGNFLIRCPVDYRKIYGLPANYFGNAVRDAVATFTATELASEDIGATALRIRESIVAVDRESVQNSLNALEDLRQKNGSRIFSEVSCPGLLVSNFSKFPIPEIDFGLGSPLVFHHTPLRPGMALILPSTDGVEIRFQRPLAD